MSTDVYPNGALLRRPPAFLVIAAERGSASCVDLTPRTRILARDLIGDARTRTGEARESGELGPSMDTAFRCSPYARTPATDWIGMSCDEFVNAAHRKMRILEYHLDCLENAIEGEPNVDPVPIPVQAHFEGVLGSFAACADQIAAGLQVVTGRSKERAGLGEVLVDLAPENGPLFVLQQFWRSSERKDINEVRRLATHYHYDKFPQGEGTP